MQLKVINGNNIDILKQYPDNYFDAIVTDAPYGLGKEPIAIDLMKDWIEKGYHEVGGSGFMGKQWDAFVPQPLFWKECFRVLKHGGHVLSFFGTRTYDWGVMAMRFAGFEIRDCIQWLYGSGFPKSYNVAKGIEGKIVNGSSSWNDWKKLDGKKEQVSWGYSKGQAKQGYRDDYTEANKERVGKINFKSEEAKQWEGWGSALKPANEPIVLARKPLEKGLSIAENVLKWGTGAINIDKCRVGSEIRTMPIFSNDNKNDETTFNLNSNIQHHREETSQGRFPANLILSCSCENENEHNEDCPIKILDEQSGESKSTNTKRNRNTIGSFGMPNDSTPEYADKGGASRFFQQCNFEENDFVRFQYTAKASKSERNKGLEGFEKKQMAWSNQAKAELKRGNTEFADDTKMHNKVQERVNFHPTVKPIKLMQYLVRLVTPPNGIVLDPFCGSGTTGIACKLEGFQFVGCEQDAEYCKIAQARIENYVEENIKLKTKLKTEENTDKTNIEQLNLF